MVSFWGFESQPGHSLGASDGRPFSTHPGLDAKGFGVPDRQLLMHESKPSHSLDWVVFSSPFQVAVAAERRRKRR